MFSKKEKHIIIEKYLDGKLSRKDQMVFEARLDADADFALEVGLQKDLHDFGIQKDIEALENGLNALGEEGIRYDLYGDHSNVVKKRIFRLALIGAAVLATLGVLLFYTTLG